MLLIKWRIDTYRSICQPMKHTCVYMQYWRLFDIKITNKTSNLCVLYLPVKKFVHSLFIQLSGAIIFALSMTVVHTCKFDKFSNCVSFPFITSNKGVYWIYTFERHLYTFTYQSINRMANKNVINPIKV